MDKLTKDYLKMFDDYLIVDGDNEDNVLKFIEDVLIPEDKEISKLKKENEDKERQYKRDLLRAYNKAREMNNAELNTLKQKLIDCHNKNTELKGDIANIKTLSEKEVEGIIKPALKYGRDVKHVEAVAKAICKLAIKDKPQKYSEDASKYYEDEYDKK